MTKREAVGPPDWVSAMIASQKSLRRHNTLIIRVSATLNALELAVGDLSSVLENPETSQILLDCFASVRVQKLRLDNLWAEIETRISEGG